MANQVRRFFAKATLVIGHPEFPNDAGKRLTFDPGQPLVDDKGQPLKLDDQQIVRLLQEGSMEEERGTVAQQQQQQEPTAPKAKADRLAAISAAIGKLGTPEKNEENFTGKGVPSTTALRHVLGWEVSADERNEAWAAQQKK